MVCLEVHFEIQDSFLRSPNYHIDDFLLISGLNSSYEMGLFFFFFKKRPFLEMGQRFFHYFHFFLLQHQPLEKWMREDLSRY